MFERNAGEAKFKRAEMPWAEFFEMVRANWPSIEFVRHVVMSRPDLEIPMISSWHDLQDDTRVVQNFWGNVPGWDRDLLAYRSVLDAIEDYWRSRFGGTPIAAILVDNESARDGSVISVHSQPFVQFALPKATDPASGRPFFSAPDAGNIQLYTGPGDLWIHGEDTILREMRSLQLDGFIGSGRIEAFTTMVRWRWPECRVYSFYVRGDEGVVREEPLPFEL